MSSEENTKEQILRERILELVSEYYREVHRPTQTSEFVPGESFLNYAGRIFDEDDICRLTDATLDFYLTAGRFAKEFETSLAKWLGLKYALLVNSGSSANLLAFATLTSPSLGDRKIERGDEVITVAAGFPTTVTPSIQFGAVPVFVDIELENGTYNIDTRYLEQALSPRTKAVMLAHTLGNPFDLQPIVDFCKKHSLWLVEDNCDALGSLYDGKLTGTFGDLATSSFYPAHHITMGEGGAVYTGSGKLKSVALSIRDWGRDCWCDAGKDNTCGKRFQWKLGELPEGYDHKYIYSHFGYNLKVSDMQAAVGCAQLRKLDSFVAARKENWQILREALCDLEEYFVLPNPTANSEPSWFGFLLTVREDAGFTRNEITTFLESKKIQTRNLFSGNMLRHPLFNEMRKEQSGYRVVGELKNSDIVMNDTFWVGVYPGLSKQKMEFIAEQIRSFVKR